MAESKVQNHLLKPLNSKYHLTFHLLLVFTSGIADWDYHVMLLSCHLLSPCSLHVLDCHREIVLDGEC
jgi:hypothetical protein